MYYRDDNVEYIHFTSNTICNQFCMFIKEEKTHFKISHKCCSGLGCGIYINDGVHFNPGDIKKEFECSNYFNSNTFTLVSNKNTDFCCVCYESTNYATKCGHYVCSTCEKKLQTRELQICPYCRSNL